MGAARGAPLGSRLALYACGCGALLGLQLWLAAPDEVVASPNRYDQLRYLEAAQQIAAGRWLGPYDERTLIREPAYPAWVAWVSARGWRLRTAAELLLGLSACLYGAVWVWIGLPVSLALAATAALLLQPHAFLVNREVLPAGFYLPWLLVALSGVTLAAHARHPVWRGVHAAWTGLALGLLWVTRPEKPLLAGALLCAVGVDVVARARRQPRGAWLRDAAILLIVPSLVVAGVVRGVAQRNLRQYGVSVTSELEAPGYLAASRALLAIEHASPRRHVPVPEEVRLRAYAASSAFRELQPTLEAPSWARRVSCAASRVCDDIAGGWWLWLLREAAARAGHMQSAPEAEAYFQRIADELRAACERGELRCRTPRLAFAHPYPETWIAQLPHSLGRTLSRMASFGGDADRRPPRDDPSLGPALRRRFDRMAGRRPALSSEHWWQVEGYAEWGPDAEAGRAVAGLALGRADEWVPLELRSDGHRVEFEFLYEQLPRPAPGARLEISRVDGERTRLPLRRVAAAPIVRDGLRVAFTRYEPLRAGALQDGLRGALWTAHALALRVAAGAALLAGLVLLLRWPRCSPAFWVALATSGALVLSRWLLLSVIDASSFGAASSRYLYPAIALVPCFLLLWIHAGWRALRGRERLA